MNKLLLDNIHFNGVKGVGSITLDLMPEQHVYTFIGENGIGKTKLLESLFSALFLSQNILKNSTPFIKWQAIPFTSVTLNECEIKKENIDWFTSENPFQVLNNNLPLVLLSAQQRGSVGKHNNSIQQLGNRLSRLKNYLEYVLECFNTHPERLKTLNMDTNIEEWIIQRAQSANPYQAKEDNRQIELTTLSLLLNKVDNRIDPEFLEISGDNRVFIKVENQKRELSELSSGFTSILKILQAIIAGYSYFTNEVQIANVRGIVLIDEIESHLHNQWQANIIPLLKALFPNTIFFITTHSSLVISQLKHGEAYRLERNKEGVVESHLIENPGKVSFIDLLNDAFGVDLNQLKINRAKEEGQKEAKKALLALVQQELENMEANHG